MAQKGSEKGHNSGFSVQKRQLGVMSLNEISGVKLRPLTISVLSMMKFFTSSSAVVLKSSRNVGNVALWKPLETSRLRKHVVIFVYMLKGKKNDFKFAPKHDTSTRASPGNIYQFLRMRRLTLNPRDVTKQTQDCPTNQSAYLKNTNATFYNICIFICII